MFWRRKRAQPAQRLEAQLQRACVKRLRARYPHVITYRGDGGTQLAGGPAAYRLRKMEGTTKGAPDLLICLADANGKLLAIEFKAPDGQVMPHQQDCHELMRMQNITVEVVRSIEQFDEVLTR